MEIEVFWNRAIEYHCLKGYNETVLISIAEDSLQEIYNEYVDTITEIEFKTQTKQLLAENGGAKDSYFKAVTNVLFNRQSAGFGFLKFSFFVVCAFSMETTSGYWRNFDRILGKYTPRVLYSAYRTELINKIIDNLSKYCIHNDTMEKYDWESGKNFLNINIYGPEATWVNVGRIYAHSIFSNTLIKKVKKAMYELGFAYTKTIEYLSDHEISIILEKSKLPRIIKIFQNDEIKGLVNESLYLWLKNWIPNEEEESSFANKVYERTDTQLFRIWHWDQDESNKQFNWIYGFISKEKLGEEGKIILNEENDIYINLDRSSNIDDDVFLYVLDNLTDEFSGTLENEPSNLKFKNPENYNNDYYSLKNIKNTPYYLQIDKPKILYSSEFVFIASTKIIKRDQASFCGQFSIDSKDREYYIYRVKDFLEYNGTEYVKTNAEIEVVVNGITIGVQGRSLFLNSYPITISFGNVHSGTLEITDSENIIKNTYNLSDSQFKLNSTLTMIGLPTGDYKIKIKSDNGDYIIFKNGEPYKTFGIAEEGTGDRRTRMTENNGYFEYKEFPEAMIPNNICTNFILLFKNNQPFNNQFLDHQLFDFCFKKDEYSNWVRETEKQHLFFAALLDHRQIEEDPGREYERYGYDSESYTYKDNDLVEYTYQAKPVSCFSKEFDISTEIYLAARFPENSRVIYLKYYCFELMQFGSDLHDKHPSLFVGKKVYIISNDKVRNVPEKLLKMITQEVFPFKY